MATITGQRSRATRIHAHLGAADHCGQREITPVHVCTARRSRALPINHKLSRHVIGTSTVRPWSPPTSWVSDSATMEAQHQDRCISRSFADVARQRHRCCDGRHRDQRRSLDRDSRPTAFGGAVSLREALGDCSRHTVEVAKLHQLKRVEVRSHYSLPSCSNYEIVTNSTALVSRCAADDRDTKGAHARFVER